VILPLVLAAALAAPVVDSTWVDHDAAPIAKPRDWEPGYWSNRMQRSVVDPIAHVFDVPDKLLAGARALGADTRREAVDVNAFDEVPDNSWFTNRNHVRAVPPSAMREGPDGVDLPKKPWTITHPKHGGTTEGFQIKDADGRHWLVKLDPRGYAQISSCADMVVRTLLHAAGYNVPHNEPVRFVRSDLAIAPDLLRGTGRARFSAARLDSDLAWGARFPDGSYAAMASLFVAGKPLGSPSLSRRRPGDTNDWYSPVNRRELRGLYVLCSWLGDWDTEDHQLLDTFVATRDSLGHVEHVLLDLNSAFGAMSTGPKFRWAGYEYGLDLGAIAGRVVTLGFVNEPWRRAHQETGLPSIGLFESAVYEPQKFKGMSQQPAFRAMTDRDGYWGAKLVASFSDAQIAAAVDAAHYDDPRARDFLVRQLIVRRDKTARYWFGRVAPLDFFTVAGGALRFHDLAVDLGLSPARAYDAAVLAFGADGRHVSPARLHVDTPALPLARFADATRLSLALRVAGQGARPTRVDLSRKDASWLVTRVRHA